LFIQRVAVFIQCTLYDLGIRLFFLLKDYEIADYVQQRGHSCPTASGAMVAPVTQPKPRSPNSSSDNTSISDSVKAVIIHSLSFCARYTSFL
jgi:hypothetical protein